jgi:hypothetical protein
LQEVRNESQGEMAERNSVLALYPRWRREPGKYLYHCRARGCLSLGRIKEWNIGRWVLLCMNRIVMRVPQSRRRRKEMEREETDLERRHLPL